MFYLVYRKPRLYSHSWKLIQTTIPAFLEEAPGAAIDLNHPLMEPKPSPHGPCHLWATVPLSRTVPSPASLWSWHNLSDGPWPLPTPSLHTSVASGPHCCPWLCPLHFGSRGWRLAVTWAALDWVLPAHQGRWSFPLSTLVRPHL